ncbi:hypothetical protein ACCO45_002295 [Purpureocillium lilacinum]|uniref:Uncharacterized protein n=1 Tax=Purpureocillium lilacinum TaxID=33203 RepID=A0ACC4EBV6_PURLI
MSESIPDSLTLNLPEGLGRDELKSFKPFQSWISTLNNSLSLQSQTTHPFHSDPYALRSVTVQSFDRFGGSRLGFVKLSATVSNSASEALPAAALLRGPSVAMLVMLIPDDLPASSDERYAVLTVQPRVPAGSLGFVELPAGMVDDAGSFKEQLPRRWRRNSASRSRRMSWTAAGDVSQRRGCDEHITIYSYERRIPRDQLREWSGRLTGLRDHGEKITLKVVPMKDLWREGARDAKALAAVALWEGLRREGKV